MNDTQTIIQEIKGLISQYGNFDTGKEANILPIYFSENKKITVIINGSKETVLAILFYKRSPLKTVKLLTDNDEIFLDASAHDIKKLLQTIKEVTSNEELFHQANCNYLKFISVKNRTLENIISSFFYYMWNKWSEEECQELFQNNANHIWKQWTDACNKNGTANGAAEILYKNLSDNNRKILVRRAILTYDGNKKHNF